MAYGQNGPWGLQATKTLTGAQWNGQTNPYLIASGYAQNIFKGDLVYLSTSGYVKNLFDYNGNQTTAVYGVVPSLGVFNGCSFITPTSVNPIDPASPGRSYWPSGTNTLNAVPAIADIIDDPNVIYNVQSNLALTQAMMGLNAQVDYTFTGTRGAGAQVSGNTLTGQSTMFLNQSVAPVNTATFNLRLIRFVAVPGNLSGVTYNNAEVLIQNHFYQSRPAGSSGS